MNRSADRPTALIADDEPLLRERLRALLARQWPELEIVAEARNGREAIELFEQHRPAIAFLDVHMPGVNGLEAARAVARRARVVFVTAFEQYAVKAFEEGAIDYVLKPFDEARLADTVARLKERTGAAPAGLEDVLARLAAQLKPDAGNRLQWIKASVGASVRLIPVEQVAFFQSDDKYTRVVTGDGEVLIRKSIKELLDELDPAEFVQIHRSTIVNLRKVSRVVRGERDSADLHLNGVADVLTVSRSYLHLFRQM